MHTRFARPAYHAWQPQKENAYWLTDIPFGIRHTHAGARARRLASYRAGYWKMCYGITGLPYTFEIQFHCIAICIFSWLESPACANVSTWQPPNSILMSESIWNYCFSIVVVGASLAVAIICFDGSFTVFSVVCCGWVRAHFAVIVDRCLHNTHIIHFFIAYSSFINIDSLLFRPLMFHVFLVSTIKIICNNNKLQTKSDIVKNHFKIGAQSFCVFALNGKNNNCISFKSPKKLGKWRGIESEK